jgi:hypothetical protein
LSGFECMCKNLRYHFSSFEKNLSANLTCGMINYCIPPCLLAHRGLFVVFVAECLATYHFILRLDSMYENLLGLLLCTRRFTFLSGSEAWVDVLNKTLRGRDSPPAAAQRASRIRTASSTRSSSAVDGGARIGRVRAAAKASGALFVAPRFNLVFSFVYTCSAFVISIRNNIFISETHMQS